MQISLLLFCEGGGRWRCWTCANNPPSRLIRQQQIKDSRKYFSSRCNSLYFNGCFMDLTRGFQTISLAGVFAGAIRH
jgi:hypothetical protein